MLDGVKEYLRAFRDEKAGFNPTFTQEILCNIDNSITTYSSKFKDKFIFSQKYRFDIYLTACGFAIKSFEENG